MSRYVDEDKVKHGIWLTIKCRDPIDGHSYEIYKCSVCGAIEDRKYKCFTCGAKMDGGKDSIDTTT